MEPVLANATKQDKARILDVWPDAMSMLTSLQRSLLEQGKVVAASANSVIIAFATQMQIYVQQAQQNATLRDALHQALQKLLHQDLQIIFMTEGNWQSLRSDYLQRHQTHKTPTAPASSASSLVTKAKELFGDAVQIENN